MEMSTPASAPVQETSSHSHDTPSRYFLPALAGLYFLILIGYGAIDYTHELFKDYNLHAYIRMAEAFPAMEFETGTPVRFRVLGPWLARVLPVPLPWGFKTVSMLSWMGALLGFYYVLQAFGFSHRLRAVLGLMLCLNPYLVGFTAWNYFNVHDALGFAILVWTLYFGIKKRWRTVCILLCLGALTREFCMMAIPVMGLAALRQKDWRALTLCGLSAAPAALIFMSMRWLWGDGGFDAFGGAEFGWYKQASPEALFRLFINSWAPLSLLPFVWWKPAWIFVKNHSEWLLLLGLVYLAAFFAEDRERLILPAAPAFFAIVGHGLRTLKPGRGFWAILWIACILSHFHHQMGLMGWPSRESTIIVRMFSLSVLTGAAVYMTYKMKRTQMVGK